MQAIGVALYCLLVALLVYSTGQINIEVPTYLGIACVLFTLVISVAIVGSLVFGKAFLIFMKGDKAAALYIVGYTIFFGAVIGLVSVATFAYFAKPQTTIWPSPQQQTD